MILTREGIETRTIFQGIWTQALGSCTPRRWNCNIDFSFFEAVASASRIACTYSDASSFQLLMVVAKDGHLVQAFIQNGQESMFS